MFDKYSITDTPYSEDILSTEKIQVELEVE